MEFFRKINEKTISIPVSVLKNYCPIFYGTSGNWVVIKDMFSYFKVDCILRYNRKCCGITIGACSSAG